MNFIATLMVIISRTTLLNINLATTANAMIKKTKTGWRRHKSLIQFAEYMVGGGVYFWGGLGVFATCFDALHWPWWISKGLADIFGWSANYAIQRYWAFYDSRLKGQDRRVIFRYVI